MLDFARKLISLTPSTHHALLPSIAGTAERMGRVGAPSVTVMQRVMCATLALALNVVFVWGAFQGTATVQPLRAWERPALTAQTPSHLALDGQHRIRSAALVE